MGKALESIKQGLNEAIGHANALPSWCNTGKACSAGQVASDRRAG